MGYCRQALGDTGEALRYYEQSEMLNPRSRWTQRRLAACQRALGNYEAALRHYRRLAEEKPDDVGLTLNIGLCLLKLRRYDEALGGDYDRCETYTRRVLALGSNTPTDWLNAGHLALVTGDLSRAADMYATSIAARDFDTAAFMADMRKDREAVKALAELNPLIVGIVADRAALMARDHGHRI